MAVRGLTKNRQHNFGRQAAFGTPVAATKAYLLSGVPDVELNWTDPEVDAGALVTVAAPHREAPDLTADLDIPQLRYNYLPLLFSGFFGGQVVPTGGGTAKTWPYAPSAVAPLDDLDPLTYEFGDDVVTDWYQLTDGVVESFEISIPVGLGACTGSATLRFGDVASTGSTDSPVTGTVPTPDLSPDANETVLYGKDMAIYIADTQAGLGAGQILDALYSGTIRFSGDLDLKRYANGTQTFEVSDVVRANIMVEYEFRFAKSEDIVGTGSESDDWMSDQSVDRYMRLLWTSTVEAQGGTFYSFDLSSPTRYYTRTEDAEGGNSVVVLTARAWYDAVDFEGFLNATIVNTLTEAELGEAGS